MKNRKMAKLKQIINSPKRILVVGSWAKEQITIKNLKKAPNIEVFAYMDTKNPGILSSVKEGYVGNLSDVRNIVEYAKQKRIDLSIITTASPLSLGLVDALKKENICVFGPEKIAAKLESDKSFARNLLKKYKIKALPKFAVFDNINESIEYARNLDWKVAVKPIGLTEGLGVKVFANQLKDEADVVSYIYQVFNKKIGGKSKILIEEKLEGEEFTIQCFVAGHRLIPTPAVQDFKRLLPGEAGPNTGGMGSYSDVGYLLPFMHQKDYDSAIDIMQNTIEAFHSETGKFCVGFLYGQFMITANGVKLIEYNFRPGDPEWMNTLSLLKENILDVIKSLYAGENISLHFEKKATVCKYIVPPTYPEHLYKHLNISFCEKEINDKGVNVYYSCGIEKNGKLNVGAERGIALISKGMNISEANRKVEEAILSINGNFYYRKDIGSKELIEYKVNNMKRLRNSKDKIVVRNAEEKEFLNIYRFISKCKLLEGYAEHFYKIMLRHFGNICFVACNGNKIVGVLMGFISQNKPKTYFLWQIGVSSFMQRKGIGALLLRKTEREVKKIGCEKIEVTIDPENISSQRLFEKIGYKNISSKEGEIIEVNDNIAVKDYYKYGRHFMVYEKKLLKRDQK